VGEDTDDSLEVMRTLGHFHTVSDHFQAVNEAVIRMFPSAPKKKKGRKSHAEPANGVTEALPAIDVLVDTIIGFLEESTAYMRAVANQVFTLLSVAVERKETLELILTVSISQAPEEKCCIRGVSAT
jgi:DNA polymerase phi